MSQYKIGSDYLTHEQTTKCLSQWYKDKRKKEKKREKRKKKVDKKVAQLRRLLVGCEREIKEFLKDDDLGAGWYKKRYVRDQLDESVDISGYVEGQFSWYFDLDE